jgi:hypothetical protein
MKEKLMSAIDDIVVERKRQIEQEGWTLSHDDTHSSGELGQAAACFAIEACFGDKFESEGDEFLDRVWLLDRLWPWDRKWWKPKNRRYDLVRAGALIVAEIERLDRSKQVA